MKPKMPLRLSTIALISLCPIILGSTAMAQSADDSILAVYAGGKVTIQQVVAKAKEMTGPGRALATFDAPDKMYDAAARKVAVRAILLNKAAQQGLESLPGWKVAQKLIESRALANVLLDATWFSVNPTEQEIESFIKDNPEMAALAMNSKGAEGTATAGSTFCAPSRHDWVVWQVRADRVSPLVNALMDDATSKHSLVCASDDNWAAGKGEDVLVRCAGLQLTKKEIGDLSQLIGQPIVTCAQLQGLANGNESMLPLGDLARSKDFASKPECQAAQRTERESWLAWAAQNRTVRELHDSYAPSEAEIKDYYDHRYQGMQDQVVKTDAILCPVVVDAGASEGTRQSASDKAQSLAASLIMRLQQGGSLEEVLKEHPECRYVEPSSRYIRPETSSSVSASVVAGVAAGHVALQPVEENGGFCVVRVIENTPQQKLSLDNARASIQDSLRSEFMVRLATDPEAVILEKSAFTVQKDAMAGLIKPK